MKQDFQSVEEYIAAQPEAPQAALRRVRSAIRKAAPEAVESISYKMPTYKLGGERLLYFAAWKRHFSLYPATQQLIEAFKDELSNYDVDKSTIRFAFSEPVPARLIERIAKFRVLEIAERKAREAR